jgi:hypothetical protein
MKSNWLILLDFLLGSDTSNKVFAIWNEPVSGLSMCASTDMPGS